MSQNWFFIEDVFAFIVTMHFWDVKELSHGIITVINSIAFLVGELVWNL